MSDTTTRPHHQTTTLTVNKYDFDSYRCAAEGTILTVRYCNDIVSSAKGGASVFHHRIRRAELIRLQYETGYKKLNIRTLEYTMPCELVSINDTISSDECFGELTIRKIGL